MQREQLPFVLQFRSSFCFPREESFSLIIIWHHTTFKACIFSTIAPSERWATHPQSANDKKLLPKVFFTCKRNHFRAWEIWCTVARNAKEKETCRSASASLQPASNEKSMKRTNRITFQTIIWICQSYPSPPLTEVFPEETTHPCECHIFSKIQNSVESIHITKNICPTSCRVSGTGRLAGVLLVLRFVLWIQPVQTLEDIRANIA